MKKIFTFISILTLFFSAVKGQTITDVQVGDITCNSASTGVINVETDAIVGFDYQLELLVGGVWTSFIPQQPAPSFPNFTITGLFAGTFQLSSYVTGGVNPVSTWTNIVISQPAPVIVFGAPTVDDVSCNGGDDGSISLLVLGGTPPYTYSWSNGQTTNPAINLFAGTYTCTISDANNCPSITSSATVSQPALPLTTTITSTPVSCHGEDDGTATVTPNGGTSPYSFLWSDGQTTNPAINLFSGAYTCVITDANGCDVTSSSETVTQPAAPLSGGVISTDVSCFGGNDGTATASGNNGTPPYTYNWSDSQTTNVAVTLLPGTYDCIITDANGCPFIVTANINQPAAALDAGAARLSFTYPLYNSEDITCNGLSDGEAEAWGTFGTPPYSFLWSDGQTTAIATGLSSGSYSCTVTDANGCPDVSNTVTLVDPPLLIDNGGTSTPAICNGDNTGTATANASGGTGGYTYQWNDPLAQTNQTATGLLAGTYTCNITDANNCTITISVTVGEPAPLSVTSSSTPVSCTDGNDGTATVNVTGGTPGYSYSWSTGQNTATASGLEYNVPGYTCVVIDANGCLATTLPIAITEPAELVSATTTSSMVSCFGGSDGTATVIASGGTPGYTYVWSDGQIGQPATGLSAGTYTCLVTDVNGCDFTASVTVAEPPVALAINPTAITHVDCNGNSTGAATVFPTGGMPPYAFTWTGPAPLNTVISNIDNIFNETVGTYTCVINDFAGCQYVETVVINEPDVIGFALSPIVNNPDCPGGNSGDITVIPNGGVPPFSYQWDDPLAQTTATASGLFAGTYTCVITDANNCSPAGATTIVTLVDPAPISFSIDVVNSTPVLCAGQSTGAIALNVSGGNQFNPPAEPYLFSWSNGVTTNLNDFLPAGNYSCQIIDANGCPLNTGPLTVTEPLTALSATITNIINQQCNPENNLSGSLTVTTGNTGTPGYTYQWSNGFTGNVASGLLPSTYTCLVTDFNGCQFTTDPATVLAADLLLVSTVFQEPSCNSTTIGVANDGTATAIVSGGTGTYFYQWDDPFLQTTETAVSLIAGTYTVTVTDGNGCLATDQVTISEPSPDIEAYFETTDVNCFGDNTGSITMTHLGGTSPFNYSWIPNGETTSTIQNLSAQTYTCNISDATGCITVAFTTIFQNPVFTAPLIANPMTVLGANDGDMYVVADGGLPPYTYNWVEDATTLSVGNTASINLLGPGTYTCTVTDAAGCVVVSQGLIPNPGCALTVTDNISTINCHGDSATVFWTNSNGLPPYTNTLLDPNGVPVNLTAMYGTNQFTTNAPQPLLLDAGVYLLQVTDANGCFGNAVAQINLQIVEPDPITMTVTTTDVACHGDFTGTVVAVASGGTPPLLTTFAVNGSGIPADPNALAAGTYSVTTTDANGCMEDTIFIINEPASALALAVTSTPEGCMPTENGTATVTATGGTLAYTYLWNDLLSQITQTASGLLAGSYNCVVTDGNGCTETITEVVSSAPGLTLGYAGNPPTCNGSNDGSITTTFATGTLPISYIWEDAANPGVTISTSASPSSLSQGVYTLVSATDFYGCPFSIPAITLTDPALISISTTTTNPTLNGACDGSITVNSVVGGDGNYISYEWIGSGGYSSNLTNISSLCEGTYQLTVTDGNGCVGYAVENIIDPACNVEVSTFDLTQPTCYGNAGSLIFTTTGGQAPYTSTVTEYGTGTVMYSGLVDPPPAVSLLAGNYYLSVVDNLGCSAQIQDVFVVDPLPLTFALQLDSTTCNGLNNGIATVTASGGSSPYIYNWSNNPGNNTPINSGLFAGIYNVEVTDQNNCTSTPGSPFSYSIGEPAPISISPFNPIEPSCNLGGDGMAMASVTGGTPPYNYSWSPSGETTMPAINLFAGPNTLLVTDANGCTENSTETMLEPAPLVPSLIPVHVDCYGGNTGSITASALGGTTPYSYLWNTGVTTSFISGLTAGTYSCTVTDASGLCANTVSITLTEGAEIVSNLVPLDASCFGLNDGSASVAPVGGSGVFDVLWWDGTIASNVTSLVPATGQYWVEITDNNNPSCSILEYFDIDEPDSITYVPTIDSVTCNSLSTGQISLDSVTGGTSPYTYTLYDAGGLAVGLPNLTGVFTSLPAGIYSYDIIDALGCSTVIPNSDVIYEPNAIISNAVIDSINCNGGSDGSIVVSPTGENNNFTYFWTTLGATTPNVSGLSNIVYTVTITPTNGCPDHTENFDMAMYEPTPVATAISSTFYDANGDGIGTEVQCFGFNNGSATINASGGTGPYTYLWNDPLGQVSSTCSPLTAGTYACLVTDANGCSTTDNITLTEPADVTNGLVTVNSTCNGSNDGYAEVFPTGMIPGNFDVYYNGTLSVSTVFTPVSPGIFNVYVINTMTNCTTDTETVTITEPNAITYVPTIDSTTCNSLSTGQISLSVTGGTSPYTYTLYDASGLAVGLPNLTGVFTSLPAGIYSYDIIDALGCSTVIPNSDVIYEPNAIISNAVIDSINCNGGSDGSIVVSPTGENNNFTYFWTTLGATTPNVSGLSNIVYTVTITPTNGCPDHTENFDMAMYEPTPVATAISSTFYDANGDGIGTEVQCFGFNNGSATINASGGTGPYTYLWNDPLGQVSSTCSPLTAGTYACLVTDANGCSTTDNITLTEPADVTNGLVTVNSTCNGSNDGYAEVFPTGMIPGNFDVYYNGTLSVSTVFTPLLPGTFNVYVINTMTNCTTDTEIFTITEPQLLTSSVTSADVICNGDATGQVSVTVSGGTTPYGYVWEETSSPGITVSTSSSVSGLGAGTYQCYIYDAGLCVEITNPVDIDEPAAMLPNFTFTDVSCFGDTDGQAIVNPTGGNDASYTYSWSHDIFNITNTSSVYAEATGLYSVTITDSAGCPEVFPFDISAPTQFTISAIVTSDHSGAEVSCNGASDGAITIIASGGNAVSYYNVAGNTLLAPANVQGGLPAGTYTIDGYDINNCPANTLVTITEPTAVSSNCTVVNVSCYGAADGSITLYPAGGTPNIVGSPYDISWNVPGVGALFAGSSTDPIYPLNIFNSGTVTVEDANGCIDVCTVSMNQPDTLIATSSSTATTCNASDNGFGVISDGTATVSVVGGTTPYTYLWSDGQTTATANGLSVGIYTCVITDFNNCSITITDTVTEPAPLDAGLVTTSVTCIGLSDGTATVNPTGFPGAYSISWSTGETSDYINGLPTYNAATPLLVTITDQSGNACGDITENVQIGTPNSPVTVSYAIFAEPSCNGGGNGQVELTGSGGTAPYTYNWPDFNITGSTSTFSPALMSAGNYAAEIVDINGCIDTITVTMTEPTAISASIAVQSVWNGYDIECHGGSNGAIIATISGGVQFPGPNVYTYSWSDVSGTILGTNVDLANLSSGTYGVTGTDFNGCPYTTTITITDPPAVDFTFVASDYNGFNIDCNGNSNGSLTGNVTGGAGGVDMSTYMWSTLATTSTISSLSAGDYTLFIEDNNGCAFDATFTINQPDPIVVNITTTPTTCFETTDGTATVNQTGGVGPFTYIWSDGQIYSTATSLEGDIAPGMPYTVSITDANGCPGGVTMDYVISPDPITTIFDNVSGVLCNGASTGVVTGLSSTGGANTSYLYSIDGGPFVPALPSYNGLSAGSFTVVAQDVNGCLGTTVETITESSPIDANLTVFDSVTCLGVDDGIIISTPTGGSSTPFDFTFSDGAVQSGSITSSTGGLGLGEYSVIVENADGCFGFDTVLLTPTNILSIDAAVTDVSCSGGANGVIEVTLVGGDIVLPQNIIWSNNQIGNPATGLSAGTYSCTITDNQGCIVSDSIAVIEPPTNLEILASSNDLKCYEDSTGTADVAIVANGQGGWNFLWNGPNGFVASTQQISGLIAGEYYVEVIDAGLCSQFDTVNIDQPDSLYADLSVIHITCFGDDNGMASAIMNGGTPNYSYSWIGPNSYTANSASISNLAPGNYTLNGLDDNGCTSSNTVAIEEPALLDAVTVVSDYNTWGVSCNGGLDGIVTITISGGVKPYVVDYNSLSPTIIGDSVFTFSNLPGGIATFDVTDFNGCELLATPIVITEPPLLEVLSYSVIQPSCFDAEDGSLLIDVLGGITPYSYWVNDVVMPLTDLSDGNYSVVVVDNNNCEVGPISLTLTEPLEILVTAELCLNSISIDVQNALGSYAITWTNDLGNLIGTDNMIMDLATGQYNLLIIDQPNGCVLDTSFALELPVINIIDATCSNSSDGSIEILLPENLSLPPVYYDIFVDGLMMSEGASISATVSDLEVGDYQISIMNNGSCEYNTVISVGYVGGYDCIDPPIIISPNFDGTNDTWKPAIDINEDIIVTIYNRWGQIEFYSETNSSIFEWDGMNNDGNKLPTADYYYVIDFINQPDKTGVITYIR